ncbi:nicotinate mononucleotide-dependent phosphoribosyltransferase CobT [Phormidesmis sp. 146-35]
MISIYTQPQQAQQWLHQYRGRSPLFACVLGFTETGLIPGISAAGATPTDRQYTAIADAEFLINGVQKSPRYPLPPLHVGASPVLISRAILAAQNIPIYLFNAGLPNPPAVSAIDLQGMPARCLSTGQAMERAIVEHLFQQGLIWGEKLAAQVPDSYLILSECVVGGTTTALAILTGLGIDAAQKVNSSHPVCNHAQKWQLVQDGLQNFSSLNSHAPRPLQKSNQNLAPHASDPIALVAAVGDPMQIVVAGMTIAASQTCGVLLAGGTQMLAVSALTQAISSTHSLPWHPQRIVVGTTRWVAEDPTGDTVGLGNQIGTIPLLATQLSFAKSRHPQLRSYEQGYVKEGVGAGGCAIAGHLFQNWGQPELLEAIETLADHRLKSDQPPKTKDKE